MTSGMTSSKGLAGPTGKVGNKIPSGYKLGQVQNFTPEAMDLLKQMFSHVSPDSYLSKLAGGDQSMFDEMEAPAMRQFNNLQSGIANRYSGMGSGGRRSSGFQNESTAGASNFAQDLASRRMELRNQAIQDLMGLSHTLMNEKPYNNYLVPKKQNNTAEMFGKLGGMIPGLISSASGGGSAGSAVKGAMSIFGG